METIFNVEKMMCGGCEANVKKVLSEVASVESIDVDLEAKTVKVMGEINVEEITATISDAGYPATQA